MNDRAMPDNDLLPSGAATIEIGGEELPVLARTQVVVVGGGPAGAMAAIAAGRQGARVTLVEPQPFLGGVATGGAIHYYYWGVNGGLQDELDRRDHDRRAHFGGHARLPPERARSSWSALPRRRASSCASPARWAPSWTARLRGVVVDGPQGAARSCPA